MNYIKELNAFRDWVILNRLSTGQIALWHALMMLCNKFGWPEQFTLSNQVLQLMTGLSRQGLDKARNQLQQRGRIEYQKGHSNQAGVYRLIYFFSFSSDSQKVGTEIDTEGAKLESHEEREGSTLFKLNTDKQKLTKSNDLVREPAVKNVLEYYQALFEEWFGKTPVIDWGKDGAIIKNLLKNFTEEELKGLINQFFASTDPFLTKAGFTIGVFKTQINKLLSKKKTPTATMGGKYSLLY